MKPDGDPRLIKFIYVHDGYLYAQNGSSFERFPVVSLLQGSTEGRKKLEIGPDALNEPNDRVREMCIHGGVAAIIVSRFVSTESETRSLFFHNFKTGQTTVFEEFANSVTTDGKYFLVAAHNLDC